MISREKAIALCEDHFPDGIERLIERLSVRVVYSDIGDVDGWCFRLPDGGRVVRLNNTKTKERQRFTLAHELAHFIIDGQDRRMTLIQNLYNPRSEEEREVDALASLLLLPTDRVEQFIGGYAIDYRAIKRLMSKARVSDIVVALRLVNSGDQFGLDRPTIVWFHGEEISKQWPPARDINPTSVSTLFRKARESPDHTAIMKAADGTKVIGSCLPNLNYPTLFYYHADSSDAIRSPEEAGRSALERFLFGDDEGFRHQLNGCIGGHKPKLLAMEDQEKIAFVARSLLARSSGNLERVNKINSREFNEYLAMKMDELS